MHWWANLITILTRRLATRDLKLPVTGLLSASALFIHIWPPCAPSMQRNLDAFTLPWEDRWRLMPVIMDEMRPLCAQLPPPRKISEFSAFTLQSTVPVPFSTAEGREKAVRQIAEVVWNALYVPCVLLGVQCTDLRLSRLRTPNIPSFKECVESIIAPGALVARNLPTMTPERETDEYIRSRAAYKTHGIKGAACGFTAPITGTYWVYDEDGRCIYMQRSAAAQWSSFVARLCRYTTLNQSWSPPSMAALGEKEYLPTDEERGFKVVWG